MKLDESKTIGRYGLRSWDFLRIHSIVCKHLELPDVFWMPVTSSFQAKAWTFRSAGYPTGQLSHWRNGCQVILSLKVHSNDALAVKTAQILVWYNIAALQSTSIIKLFPPLDDQPVGLQFKGNNHIIGYANFIQFWGRPPVHFPTVLCSLVSLASL